MDPVNFPTLAEHARPTPSLGPPLWWQIKQVVITGVLVGVKWATILLIIGAALGLLLGDYAVTRQNAAFSATWIQQVIQQQQRAAAPTSVQPPTP